MTHITNFTHPDCSGVSIEMGKYKVEKNLITFYSYWATANRDGNVHPFGFRKQVFEVLPNGKVVQKEAQVYIEEYQFHQIDFSDYDDINEYASSAEEEYNAEFILGTKKAKLEKELRKVFAKEIKSLINEWEEYFEGRYKI